MKAYLCATLIAVGIVSSQAFAPVAVAVAAETPLIARAKLFGNPSQTGGRISPDGKWLSWIAPRDGVLNVWVAPVSDPKAAKPLTSEKVRPIRSTFWSPDSKSIMFINDKGGDENFLLYSADVTTGEVRSLTPFEKTRAMIIGISRHINDHILVGLNNRDARWHDVYNLDLKTGKLTLVYQNDGYGGFIADEQLNLRVATKSRPDGGSNYFRIVGGKVDQKPFSEVSLEDSRTAFPLSFTTDGKALYWSDSRNRDTAVLLEQDMATGQTTVLADEKHVDITEALFDPKTGKLQAFVSNYAKPEYVTLDQSLAADMELLWAQGWGPFTISSRTDNDDKWIVVFEPANKPPQVYLLDRKTRQLTLLYVTRPELNDAPLVEMWPVSITARDGLKLVSYLSLPKDADVNEDAKPDKPVPLVLFVHGGPWARDEYGYHSYHQWLANRGYAVLSVNFRGSTGFGKAFINAGNMEWGRKMHDDLIDAVDWAVKSGVTTRDQVAIMGGSYGGYATLAGLTFTPETFKCGVDIVGPSNLFTLLNSIPAYWEDLRKQLYARMGDPNTDAGKAILKERSPLFSADKITKPLLIGQGANDPRVNVAESDQIVAAMRERKIPVTYVVFPDEGHGFARPVNNMAFNAVSESFLGACLKGRVEPIGDALKGSTAEVRHGAEFVPGLKDASEK